MVEEASIKHVNAVFLNHLLEMSKNLYYAILNEAYDNAAQTAIYLLGLIRPFVDEEDANLIESKIDEFYSIKPNTYEVEQKLKAKKALEIYTTFTPVIGKVAALLGVKTRVEVTNVYK